MIPKGWRSQEIGELIGLESGVSMLAENRKKAPHEYGVLKVSAVSYQKFDPSAYKVITDLSKYSVCISPKADSVLISRANTFELVGASVYIDSDYPDLFLPDKLWQSTPMSQEISMRWLHYALTTDYMRGEIKSRATGTSGSMKNISQNSFLSIQIVVPPYPEQRKIAEILSTWDEAIDLTEQLIAAKQKRKHALMQQLLTGKVRFPRYIESQKRQETPYGDLPSDWRYSPISAIAEQCSMANLDAKQLPVLSCTKHEGLVDSLEYFGRKMFSDDLSSYKVVTKHQFAYATNHIEEGSIGYQDQYDAALISPMYTVFETDKKRVVDRFLYRILKTEKYRQIFALNTNGSVNRRGSLRWKEFSKISVPLPSVEEQKHISSVLDTCDEELSLLQQKLDALRLQKKGLMQQLLTGKIRVKG